MGVGVAVGGDGMGVQVRWVGRWDGGGGGGGTGVAKKSWCSS